MAFDGDGPDPIDVHVGGRVRARRQLLKLSQAALADRLGVTFQQVQKYERGANRISASTLYRVAAALSAPMGYFFEGLADTVDGEADAAALARVEQADALFAVPGGAELARAFPAIHAPTRGALVTLVRAIAGDKDLNRSLPARAAGRA
ncbi:MAG TPA: helix-turn-helix domain-containing protein [Allosphingosinicella sp.]|nr:helix-turn-helix domain-containing protein [Allosphingosinicella sp.]